MDVAVKCADHIVGGILRLLRFREQLFLALNTPLFNVDKRNAAVTDLYEEIDRWKLNPSLPPHLLNQPPPNLLKLPNSPLLILRISGALALLLHLIDDLLGLVGGKDAMNAFVVVAGQGEGE